MTRSRVLLLTALALSLSIGCPSPPLTRPTPAAGKRALPVSVGDDGMQTTVDPDGNLTVRVPIDVPPGPRGTQPKLALRYSSGGSDGLLGVGWQLEGLSSITRCPRIAAVDRVRGAVLFDGNDRYCLDGQRLINVSGVYGAAGSVYRSERESWRLVVASSALCGSGPCQFNTTDKDGTARVYGGTADSRAMAGSRADVRSWLESSIVDTNGNRVDFSYAHNGEAQPNLTTLSYGGNGAVAANRSVKLLYDEGTRKDPIKNWVGGVSYSQTSLLRHVQTFVDQTLVSDYALAYDNSVATSRALLRSIQRCSATQCLAPTTMAWNGQQPPTFTAQALAYSKPQSATLQAMGLDVNGDGIGDLVAAVPGASVLTLTPAISNGSSFNVCASSLSIANQPAGHPLAGDLSGDGLADFIYTFDSGGQLGYQLYFAQAGGCSYRSSPSVVANLPRSPTWQWPADVNGDGLTDLVAAWKSGGLINVGVMLSTGSALSPATQQTLALDVNAIATELADVNGDGMVDLVQLSAGANRQAFLRVALSSGTGFNAPITTTLPTVQLLNTLGAWPVDVNRDGLTDLVLAQVAADGTLSLQPLFADGAGGWSAGTASGSTTPAQQLAYLGPVDTTGSGTPSVVAVYRQGNAVLGSVFTPAGGVFDRGSAFATNFSPSVASQVVALDYNGDGKADLVQVWANGQVSALAGLLNAGPESDLVCAVDSSLGGLTSVVYGPMSDPTLYTPGAARPAATGEALGYAYRITPAAPPFQRVGGGTRALVRTLTRANDPARNASSYRYLESEHYAGGLIALDGRGWLGFKSVERTQEDSGRVIVTGFNQAFPLTGTTASVAQYCDGALSKDPKCAGSGRKRLNETSNTFVGVQVATGAGPIATAVLDVRVQEISVASLNYGAPDFTRLRRFQYDDYGNQRLLADYGAAFNGARKPKSAVEKMRQKAASSPVYTCSNYLNRVSPTGWALGFLRDRKVSSASTCDFSGFVENVDFHLEHFSYDDQLDQASYAIYDNGIAADLKTLWEYDAFGNRTKETLPGGRWTQISYESVYHTYPESQTLAPNQAGATATTLYGYDPRFGLQVVVQQPGDQQLQTCIDDLGQPTALQGPRPSPSVSTSPSCLGMVSGEVRRFDAPVVTTARYSRLVDDAKRYYVRGEQLDSWAPESWRWRNAYLDGLGRQYQLVAQSDENPAGVLACSNYDADGNAIRSSLPAFLTSQSCSSSDGTGLQWTTQTLDAYGRPVSVTTPLTGSAQSTTRYQYGPGMVTTVVKGAGSDDELTTVVTSSYFNGQRKIVSLGMPQANAAITYSYDPTGALTSVLEPATKDNPQGISTTIKYDSVGRRVVLDNPDQNTTGRANTFAQVRSYGPDGLLQSLKDAKGQLTRFQYDLRGRVVTKTEPDTVVQYGYDDPQANGIGLLTSLSASNAQGPVYSESFAFDGYGNRNQRTVSLDGASYSLAAAYDPQQRVVKESFPGGATVVRSYSGGNLRSLALDGTNLVSLSQYTPLGGAGRVSYSNGAVATRSYLPAGLTDAETVTDKSGAKLLDNKLGWDGQLNLRSVEDSLKPGGRDYSETFSYSLGRLIEAKGLYGDQTFDYTPDGNRVRFGDLQMAYQAHRLMSGKRGTTQVVSLAYDANGNVISRSDDAGATQLAFDSQNRLTTVQIDGAAALDNPLYGDDGRRLVKRTPDGTVVRYPLPGFEVTESPGLGKLTTVYVSDGKRVYAAVTKGTSKLRGAGLPVVGTRWLHTNQVRSTTLVLDEAGRLSSRLVYQPYGQLDAASLAGDEVRPKFQAKELEARARLYYFGARFYDAALARYLTADTGLGSDLFRVDALNRYAFALNNPATLIDPTGESILDNILGAFIGVAEIVAGVAIDVLSDGALEPLGQGLVGAGVNGILYSATAGNHFSWREYGDQQAIGFVIGAVTAGFGEIGEAGEVAASSIEMSAARVTASVGADLAEDAGGDAVESAADELAVASDSSTADDAAGSSTRSLSDEGESDTCALASFVAGTRVWTNGGLAPIESLAEGREVLSRNALDHGDRSRQVGAVLARSVTRLAELRIEGAVSETLTLTPEHPVALADGRWLPAAELRTGMELVTRSGQPARVAFLRVADTGLPVEVHNLFVAPDHSYFVGENGIWVHNPCTAIKAKAKSTSPQGYQYDIELRVPAKDYPESAKHILDAQKAGHDDVLVIDRAGAKANRRASLRGWRCVRGYDRDEYPPAMFEEGGAGADIEYIDPSDNRGSGSSFGAALRQFGDGTRVWFRVVP